MTRPVYVALGDSMSIDRYPDLLLTTLKSMAADWRPNPQVVVLTPGVYNSAYYEHAYLARLMGRRWSRAATSWCTTTWSTCAPPRACAGST